MQNVNIKKHGRSIGKHYAGQERVKIKPPVERKVEDAEFIKELPGPNRRALQIIVKDIQDTGGRVTMENARAR